MSHAMESERERDWKKGSKSAEMAIIARNAVHIIDFCFVRDIFAVVFFFRFIRNILIHWVNGDG